MDSPYGQKTGAASPRPQGGSENRLPRDGPVRVETEAWLGQELLKHPATHACGDILTASGKSLVHYTVRARKQFKSRFIRPIVKYAAITIRLEFRRKHNLSPAS